MKSILLLFFALLSASYFVNAQSRKVTGHITDDQSKEGLAGVSVRVKDKNVGTSTNNSGDFSLNLPSGSNILVISFVGYGSKEVSINNLSEINVSLIHSNEALNEVIVTALDMKRNVRSLGYSVSTIGGDQVDKVETPNIITALSGKVAGVDASDIANGVAGTKRIIIRGGSSLTGNNQPLWVIDGIPITTSTLGSPNAINSGADYGDGLTDINPDDIQSITVLKGNAAAALYGSRAANGVILVTTKSGQTANGRVHVDVSSSALFDKLNDETDYQYVYGQTSVHNAPELPLNAEDAFTSDSWGHKLDDSLAPQFDGVIRPFSAHKHNYDEFFRTGNTINNTVAMSGGSADHNYRLSVSDLRNTDIVPNSNFSRTSVDAKTHTRYGKLNVDLVFDYVYSIANNRPYIGGNNGNQFYSLQYLPANIDVRNLAPGYDSSGREVEYASGISNPYYVVNKEVETDKRNRLSGSVVLHYQFTNWLYARGRITRDWYSAQRLQYIPELNVSSSYPTGSFDQEQYSPLENNYEFLLGINPLKIGNFGVNAFAGGNIDWRSSTHLILAGNTFLVPGVHTFNNLSNKLPSSSLSEQRTNSLFGNVELSYKEYLYLTLTGRNDWFSALPVKSDNLFYPAASLSFVFSDVLKLPTWISYGKLRASTAQVSGDTGPYQLDLSYSLDPLQYLYGGGLPLQTVATSQVPNANLKPLLSTDYEIGIEMSLINNRVSFDVNYFNKNVRNDIVSIATSTTSGYSSAIVNIGKHADNGIEVLLNATPVITKRFSWNLTTTFSTLNSKIISLGVAGLPGSNIVLATAKSGNASIQLESGKPYGGIYGYTYKLDAKGNQIYNSQGLPEYNSTETRLGNGQYNKILGFNNTFNYKRFSLSVFFAGKFGADIYSETNLLAYEDGKSKATLPGREDGLIGKGVDENGNANTVLIAGYNTPTGGPGASISTYYNQIKQIAQQFVYDASFVKLREVALTYKLPTTFLKRMGITNATVAAVGRNLLIVYKNKNLDNIDPESQVSSGNDQGDERTDYPATREYGITLKFGF